MSSEAKQLPFFKVSYGFVETFTKYLALVFIVLGCLHWGSGISFDPYRGKLLFLAKVIFLNTLHVGFTMCLFIRNQSFQKWFTEKKKINPRMTLVWVVLFVLYTVLFLVRSEFSFYTKNVLAFLLGTLAGLHTIYQSFGISLLINEDKSAAKSTEKYERLLFRFVWFGTIAADFAYFFVDGHDDLKRGGIVIFLILTTIFYLSFCYYYRFKAQTKSWQKIIFLARVLLFPLSYLSIIGIVGYMSIHGLEYLGIVMRTEANSLQKHQKVSKTQNLLTLVYFVTFAIPVILPFLIQEPDVKSSFLLYWGFRFGEAYVFATVYLHYYVEGVIYKMRYRESREYILPAISG